MVLRLYHVLRIHNVIPGAGQVASPLFLSTGRKDNFKNLRVFGCRVIVPPLGSKKARFTKQAKKGIFLGYIANTSRVFYWYDIKSQRVKVGTNMLFDKGFNDLPLGELPLGAAQYVRLNHGIRPPSDSTPLKSSDLEFLSTLLPTNSLLLYLSFAPTKINILVSLWVMIISCIALTFETSKKILPSTKRFRLTDVPSYEFFYHTYQ